jgi:hypothetical protein
MEAQQAPAKRPRVSPGDRLCQKQPQMTAAAALLQIGRNVFVGQLPGQTRHDSEPLTSLSGR